MSAMDTSRMIRLGLLVSLGFVAACACPWAVMAETQPAAPPTTAPQTTKPPATQPKTAQSKTAPPATKEPVSPQKTYGTPEEAAESLIAAADRFDVTALKQILGPDGVDLVVTEDAVQDKNQAAAFAAQAHEKHEIQKDAKNPKLATLIVGDGDWPTPFPIVENGGRWRFDSKAGRQEVLYRRIGRNELDAIEVCHGYVEAQQDYASEKHDGSRINQYAQRIVSTPGKHDGLAWKDADGTWQGPVGEGIARVIAEGYSDKYEPFHGYYFRILKGQGPAAPMGEMSFVVEGVMIGGFALVAAPAEYAVTGVKTFIVSHTGVVYEKDFGPTTLETFKSMKRFNPDATWHPVAGQ
jgi:hypothetical protein